MHLPSDSVGKGVMLLGCPSATFFCLSRHNIMTISHELLEQPWWNLHGIINSPYWWLVRFWGSKVKVTADVEVAKAYTSTLGHRSLSVSLMMEWCVVFVLDDRWDFVGNTIVTNNYVRLTSDRQSNKGAIWNTVVYWQLFAFYCCHDFET